MSWSRYILALAIAALALALFLLICASAPAQARTNAGTIGTSHARTTATAQPTNGAFKQPTVGPSTPLVPTTNTSLGSSGLAIATVLGCVTGALGLIIGSVALTILLRDGYGPFLRTLLPGARRRMARDGAWDGRNGRRTARPAGGYAGQRSRNLDRPPPRGGGPSSREAGSRRR